MTQGENVDVVRRGFEAWNRRDLANWLGHLHPEVEIDWSRSRGPLKGVYRGREAAERLWNEFRSILEENTFEVAGFTEAGSEVVAPNTVRLRGRDGIEVVARSTLVFAVENGSVARITMFQEEDEALKAVGLRE